ncbi:MAG: ATP-binding protein, partial [Pyrinomonadaceae bacterium]
NDSEGAVSDISLSEVIRTMRECVFVVGENLRIIIANNQANSVFSKFGETVVGKRFSEVVRSLEVHNAFIAALKDGITTHDGINVTVNESRTFQVTVSPLNTNTSKNAIGYFYETTRVERLEKIRQEFLSNISHELRTPLTSILAFVETLESGGINDEKNNVRFLEIIRRNAERMQALIHDISELSSIESGNISLEVISLNLYELVNEVFATLSTKAGERGIILENDVSPNIKINADVLRLEQMLVNLVDNAIKFNFEKGHVRISFSETDKFSTIKIKDTGEGIPKEHLTRVFERLYRIDRSRTREVGGTGLGLAIVKHLALLHGGSVEVNSEIGSGTNFRLVFPK